MFLGLLLLFVVFFTLIGAALLVVGIILVIAGLARGNRKRLRQI